MKCKYKCKVTGPVKSEVGISFEANAKTYEFEVQDGLITHLSITRPNFPEEALPTFTPLQNKRAKAHINIPEDPFRDDVVSELRAIEGSLCVWGIKEIDIDSMTVEWIPETDEERKSLQLFSFSSYEDRNSIERAPQAYFDLYIKTIINSPHLLPLEIPLNFYRRGRIDDAEGRHIEAIYDLYFALETLYGNGKFKKRDVLVELKNSSELVNAIQFLQAQSTSEIIARRWQKEFKDNFVSKSLDEIIERIVDIRGYLHHHTLKRTNIWHPAKQKEFQIDSLILLSICHQILSTKIFEIIYSEDSQDNFEKTEVCTSDGRKIKWTALSPDLSLEEVDQLTRIKPKIEKD